MNIRNNYTELIGKTPLLRLNRFEKAHQIEAELVAKLELFNPLSSVKDRIALALIEALERDNLIHQDTVLIEPTSGNTGIGLAFVAAAKGYKLILVMPDTMSRERVLTVQALGAQIILTEGVLGMKGAIEKANQLASENKHYVIPKQFEHLANPQIHRTTTAIEILEDTDHKLDMVVIGVGTGGTITGVGEVLKQALPHVKIIAVEPKDSNVLSGGKPGKHKIQGIGAGFIPSILNTNIYDEIITVSNEDAFKTTKSLALTEGVLVGISSGAALFAAMELAKRVENKGKRIVTILADSGERYLTTSLFD